MYKTRILVVLLAHGLTLAASVQAGGGGSVPSPQVEGTWVDAKQSIITIQGRDFGLNTPLVMLGERSLKVRLSSRNEIVAELPERTKNATYRLIVTTGAALPRSSAPFFTNIIIR
jgi:hypothetical protein